MRTLLPALAIVCLSACAKPPANVSPSPTAASARSLSLLRNQLAARIAADSGADVAVWYQDLAGPDTLDIAARTSFHAASTMKVPVMIELFRRVDARALTLDRTIRLENAFTSIVDGSPFTLTPTDDSDAQLYTRVGQDVPLRLLNDRMITRSSNLATNAIIQLLDAKKINATAHALGADHMRVLRGVEDTKAFNRGMNNTTTARDLGALMASIERGTAASPRSTQLMKEVLLRQEFNTEIPAGLPAGTPVAHKTGSITATLHDAAIVYPKSHPPYVLVILTRNIAREQVAQLLMADLSRMVYTFAVRDSRPAAMASP